MMLFSLFSNTIISHQLLAAAGERSEREGEPSTSRSTCRLAAMPKPISPSEQRGHAGDEECEGGADDSRKNRGRGRGKGKGKGKKGRGRGKGARTKEVKKRDSESKESEEVPSKPKRSKVNKAEKVETCTEKPKPHVSKTSPTSAKGKTKPKEDSSSKGSGCGKKGGGAAGEVSEEPASSSSGRRPPKSVKKEGESKMAERKARVSRKSSAYHKAYKAAIAKGLSPEDAKLEAKTVPRLFKDHST